MASSSFVAEPVGGGGGGGGAVEAMDTDVCVTPGDVLLRHFWGLAAVDPASRVAAAEGIVSELLAGADADGGVDADAPVPRYVLRRLFRGLASGRKGARQGFSLCLSELLRHVKLSKSDQGLVCAMLKTMVQVLDAETAGHGRNSLEKRNRALGKVFGIGAFVAAELLPGTDGDALHGTQMAVDLLMGVSGERYYYREVATAMVLQLLRTVDSETLETIISGNAALQAVIQSVPSPSSDAAIVKENGDDEQSQARMLHVTPESLWMSISLWPRLSRARVTACPLISVMRESAVSDETAFFSESHLGTVVAYLKETARIAPRLHSVWFALMELMSASTATKPLHLRKRKRAGDNDDTHMSGHCVDDDGTQTWDDARLRSFCTVFVDGLLMGGTMALKSIGFQLVSIILSKSTKMQIPVVLSRRVVTTLARMGRDKSNPLFPAASQCVRKILAHAKNVPNAAPTIAIALQGHGCIRFDQRTRTKSTSDLLNMLNETGIHEYVRELLSVFSDPMARMTADSRRRGESVAGTRTENDDDNDDGAQKENSAVNDENGTGEERVAHSQREWALSQIMVVWRLLVSRAEEKRSKRSKQQKTEAGGKDGDDLASDSSDTSEIMWDIVRFLLVSSFYERRESPVPRSSKKKRRKKTPSSNGEADHADGEHEAIEELFRGLPGQHSPELSADDRRSCATRLMTLLTSGSHESKIILGDGSSPSPTKLVAALQLLEATGDVRCAIDLDTDIDGARGRALEVAVDKKSSAFDGDMQAFASGVRLSMLKLFLCTMVYPEEDLAELIDDLYKSYESILAGGEDAGNTTSSGKKSTGTKTKSIPDSDVAHTSNGDASDDIDPRNVVVDVVLSLSSRSSVVMRNIAENLFRGFSSMLTRTGLEDMLRVLAKSVRQLGDDDDEEEGDDDEDDDDEDGDNEKDDDESLGDDDEIFLRPNADNDEGGDEGEDDGDVDMDDGEEDDDEAMFRADAGIAAMLRARKDRKKGQKDSIRELQYFQLRVLGLLEMFLKSPSAAPLAEYCILPFVKAGRAVQGGEAIPELRKRLTNVFVKTLCKCKVGTTDGVNVPDGVNGTVSTPSMSADALVEAARTCARTGIRASSVPLQEMCVHGIVFISKIVKSFDQDIAARASSQIGTILVETIIEDYFRKKRCKLSLKTIRVLLVSCPAAAEAVVPVLVDCCISSSNEVKCAEARHLILTLVDSKNTAYVTTIQSKDTKTTLSTALVKIVECNYRKRDRAVAAVLWAAKLLKVVMGGGGSTEDDNVFVDAVQSFIPFLDDPSQKMSRAAEQCVFWILKLYNNDLSFAKEWLAALDCGGNDEGERISIERLQHIHVKYDKMYGNASMKAAKKEKKKEKKEKKESTHAKQQQQQQQQQSTNSSARASLSSPPVDGSSLDAVPSKKKNKKSKKIKSQNVMA